MDDETHDVTETEALRDADARGYDRAVAEMRAVNRRTGSPAAQWAADYLAAPTVKAAALGAPVFDGDADNPGGGWASLPENVRMLITDAAIELQRGAENDAETEEFFAVWSQHLAAVHEGRFGRYALKADGSGVDEYRCEGCGKTSRIAAHRPGCPVERAQPADFLLFDNERQQWWKPGGWGYTSDPREAGRYSRDEAVKWALQGALGGLDKATVIVAATVALAAWDGAL